jgi:hypothetical protein
MARHHLVISGTGRAGTTFLVQLLTELGLDTGFADITSSVFPNCHAGMEFDIRQPGAPYVVKDPGMCDYLDEFLQGADVVIDHALIPVRDVYEAAQSRRHVTSTTDPSLYPAGWIPGGLWHTDDPGKQEALLERQLYKIIFALAKHDIPSTLLYFPRLVCDPDYLHRRIAFALGDIDHDSFLKAFQAVSRPELVHDFTPAGGPDTLVEAVRQLTPVNMTSGLVKSGFSAVPPPML